MKNIVHTIKDLGILRKGASNSTKEISSWAHERQQRNLTHMGILRSGRIYLILTIPGSWLRSWC